MTFEQITIKEIEKGHIDMKVRATDVVEKDLIGTEIANSFKKDGVEVVFTGIIRDFGRIESDFYTFIVKLTSFYLETLEAPNSTFESVYWDSSMPPVSIFVLNKLLKKPRENTDIRFGELRLSET